ncbi:MAG TPA: HAD-IB family phosphatase [Gaiellaceae bacterium]|nr:HAD-IB family phosphatase [Gaiellaceae bacterium]
MTATAPARAIVLDFDGTITQADLLDEMARRFGDAGIYAEVEERLHAGTITLQECITREFAPVRASLDEAVAWVLVHVRLRPGLPELVDLAARSGWSVTVLSSGFEELIRPILDAAGIDGVDVVANGVEATPDGWRVRWRDETVCAACGEPCKRGALPAGDEIVYVGDGISDRCAALASDRVFATRGLARYLDEQGLPYERFDDFHDVLRGLTG